MTIAIMHSGIVFDPAAPPHHGLVRISDIAAHLAKICMFHGATASFYSEAQHAVILASEVAKTAGALAAIYALLHDAWRAIPMAEPCFAERWSAAIHDAMDLDWPAPTDIARALVHVHASLYLAELQQLLPASDRHANRLILAGVEPMRRIIKPLPWDRAQDTFCQNLRTYAAKAGLRPSPAMAGIL